MNKKEVEKVGIEVYEKVLENNLRVYIVPKKNVNNVYVTFSTEFGSIHNEFVPINETKMVKVPDGIAHFLEHKVFEQEDGVDPFTFFSERGADLNANTSYFKTTYLFSGIDFFEENLKYLIDFVTTPYFTDENIEKEKGIIEQEIKMYLDDPYTRLYEGILYNTFVKHPMKYPIIGSIDSVRSITKDDLFKCYNTFYTTSNMFLVITGNVDPEKTIEILESIDFKNKADKQKIKLKEYNEPDKVAKEKEVIKLNVTIPKATITYKINIDKIKDISKIRAIRYLNTLFYLKFGATSLLNERLKKESVINSNIEIVNTDGISHYVVTIFAETEQVDYFINEVQKELTNLEITEKELNRRKKAMISSLMYMSDNIYKINSRIMDSIIRYGKVLYDTYSEIESLNIEEFKKLIKQIDLSNKTIFIVEPKK